MQSMVSRRSRADARARAAAEPTAEPAARAPPLARRQTPPPTRPAFPANSWEPALRAASYCARYKLVAAVAIVAVNSAGASRAHVTRWRQTNVPFAGSTCQPREGRTQTPRALLSCCSAHVGARDARRCANARLSAFRATTAVAVSSRVPLLGLPARPHAARCSTVRAPQGVGRDAARRARTCAPATVAMSPAMRSVNLTPRAALRLRSAVARLAGAHAER